MYKIKIEKVTAITHIDVVQCEPIYIYVYIIKTNTI